MKNSRKKSSIVIFLLLVMLISAGIITDSSVGTAPLHLLHKGGVKTNSRKLQGFGAVLDYDYAGPNPKHDPRGRKGGGGGRNP